MSIVHVSKMFNFEPKLTLGGKERNHHPLSENRDFSTTEHLIELRLVCKLKFVRFGQVGK